MRKGSFPDVSLKIVPEKSCTIVFVEASLTNVPSVFIACVNKGVILSVVEEVVPILCRHIGHSELVRNHSRKLFSVKTCPQCCIRIILSFSVNCVLEMGHVVKLVEISRYILVVVALLICNSVGLLSEENIVEKGVVVFEAVFALNVRRAKSGDLRLPAL